MHAAKPPDYATAEEPMAPALLKGAPSARQPAAPVAATISTNLTGSFSKLWRVKEVLHEHASQHLASRVRESRQALVGFTLATMLFVLVCSMLSLGVLRLAPGGWESQSLGDIRSRKWEQVEEQTPDNAEPPVVAAANEEAPGDEAPRTEAEFEFLPEISGAHSFAEEAETPDVDAILRQMEHDAALARGAHDDPWPSEQDNSHEGLPVSAVTSAVSEVFCTNSMSISNSQAMRMLSTARTSM